MSNQMTTADPWHRRPIRGTTTAAHVHCHACHVCHAPEEGTQLAGEPAAEAGSAEPLVYTVREAAEQLRIGYSTVREEIRTGQLRSFKVGRRRLVSGEALRAYVRERQGGGFDG